MQLSLENTFVEESEECSHFTDTSLKEKAKLISKTDNNEDN